MPRQPAEKRVRRSFVNKTTLKTDRQVEREENQSLVPEEDKIQLLREAFANPSDLRTDVELAREIGLSQDQIRRLKSNPDFYNPIAEEFKKKLPSTVIDTIKGVMRQVERGSVPASKLMLQAVGVVGNDGINLNVNVSPGLSSVGAYASQLTPMELDQEINRLLTEVYPSDISFDDQGRIVDRSDSEVIEDARYEVLDSSSIQPPSLSGDESEGTVGEGS